MKKNENSDLHFKCSISASTSYKVGEPILLTFKIKNQTGDSYQLLKWNTPLEGETHDFFIVEREGERIPYDGRLVKRGNPGAESYVVIKPGQTLSETIDLSTSYKFDKPGVYNVTIKGNILDAFIITGDTKEKAKQREEFQKFELTNEKISFKLVSDGEPKLTSGEKARKGLLSSPGTSNKLSKLSKITPHAPALNGGTASQQSDVLLAHTNAAYYVSLAHDQLVNTDGATNTLYDDWFGTFDAGRYDTVKTHYADILNALLTEEITYDLINSESKCNPGDFAYTYHNSRTVWLCSSFWTAPAIGTDSKFGTLVHELSHAVSLTNDHVYGTAGAGNLANTDPGNAIDNADNHEYFTEFLAASSYGKSCTVVTDRSTFGKDEISAMLFASNPAVIESAFYVIVDGCRPSVLGITAASLSGTPNVFPPLVPAPSITGMTISPSALNAEDSTLVDSPQRFTWTYKVSFSNVNGFPTTAGGVSSVALNASIASLSGSGIIQLVDEPNPYELDGPVSWLSTDLRVFQINGGDSKFGEVMGSSPSNAPTFIQNVIDRLNAGNTNGQSFENLSLDEDAAKLELSEKVGGTPVFNFAIAKVRFRSLTADSGTVRVFFRLFPASTTSTAFDQSTTYPRGGQTGVIVPLLGIVGGETATIPCFAKSRIDSSSVSMNTQDDPKNVKTILHNSSGNEVVAYFGCWLDINQPSQPQFPINPSSNSGTFTSGRKTIQELIRNAHQCLVAEIVMDGVNLISTGQTPGSSDKLAQRNLSIIESDNPGSPASHRISNTFEIKPTKYAGLTSELQPDELMILWGNVPSNSEAKIYIPGISGKDIIDLAGKIYPSHKLSLIDEATISCATNGVSYIPIPIGVSGNIPGLLTIDLPDTVKKGKSFKIVVRQITNAVGKRPTSPPVIAKQRQTLNVVHETSDVIRWRRIVGSFQITIPVTTKEIMLLPEIRLLSVLRWIQKSIPTSNRWFPVFNRYVEQIADRVGSLGGNPDSVLPSPSGEWQPAEIISSCFKGKVCEVIYDCFGDFEGFILANCSESRHFKSHEKAIGEIALRACKDRLSVSVCVEPKNQNKIKKIIVCC